MNTKQHNGGLFFVDWITAVLPSSWAGGQKTVEQWLGYVNAMMTSFFDIQGFVACRPRWGYALAWREPVNGVVVQFHPEREDMGINVIFTGKALSSYSWREALHAIMAYQGRVTRIDVSVDVHNPLFSADQLYRDFEAGLCETRAQTARLVESTSGTTFYVGARSSEKFLRIYDKGGEQGEAQGEHWRIELECKGSTAQFVAEVALDGLESVPVGIIQGYFNDPQNDAWMQAMGNAMNAIAVPSDKRRTDTEAWLMGLVAQTMAKVEKVRPGFLDQFYDQVIDLL